MGVHEDTDGETEALEGQAGSEDGDTGPSRLGFCDYRGDGATEHDREGRENPGGHHGLQAVGMGGEDKGVLQYGYNERAEAIEPEEDLEGK